MKAIVSFSGGMDSATILATALEEGKEVLAVVFYYGSKHNKYENESARMVCGYYGVPIRLIDLSPIMAGFKSDLMLAGGEIPEGHYEAASMSRTVVPGRNTIFASILLGIAQSEGAGEIWLGVHAGDHHIYPDCRPEWVKGIRHVIETASEGSVSLRTPFLHITKAEILKKGLALKVTVKGDVLDVPYVLTQTCYKAQEIACGRCGSCQERLEAFRLNEVVDPISYDTREALTKENS